MINKCKKYWLLLVLVLVGQASVVPVVLSADRSRLLDACDYEEVDQVEGRTGTYKFVPIEDALKFDDTCCEDYFFRLSRTQWAIYKQQSQRAASAGKNLFKDALNSGFCGFLKARLLICRECVSVEKSDFLEYQLAQGAFRGGAYDFTLLMLCLQGKASSGFLSRDRSSLDVLNEYVLKHKSTVSDYNQKVWDEVILELEKKAVKPKSCSAGVPVVKTKWGAYFAGKISSLLTFIPKYSSSSAGLSASTPKYNSCSAGVPVAVDRDDCKSNNLPKKPKDDTVNSDTKIKPFAVRAASAHHRGVKPIDVERLSGQHVKLSALKDRRGRSFSRR